MRILLDSNVFISAALKGTFSEAIIKLAIKTDFIILISSEEILKEVEKKLQSKFHWQEFDIRLFINEIRKICHIIEINEKVSVITRDPDDNKILECAVSGNADLIVSADQDLIKLKGFKGIAIVHPKTLSYTFPKYFKRKK